jgi:hypothetical protein
LNDDGTVIQLSGSVAFPVRYPRAQRDHLVSRNTAAGDGIPRRPAWPTASRCPPEALAYIAEATATRAAQADEDYAAAPAGDDTAAALGITPAHQVLVTRAPHYAADGIPIQHAEITIPTGH